MMENSLKTLFQSSHRLDRMAIQQLNDQEVSMIREMVGGLRTSTDRCRALEIFTLAAPTEALAPLGRLLRTPTEAVNVRAVSALNLGRLGPAAEKPLLEGLKTTTEPVLQAKIALALAKIGTTMSLSALETLTHNSEPAVQRQAIFSLSTIAIRNGLQGYDLPEPTPDQFLETQSQGGRVLEVNPITPDEADKAIKWIIRDSFGVELSPHIAHRFECPGNQMIVVLDKIMEKESIIHLRERRRLIGLIANRAPEDGSYSVRWLVFSVPKGNSLHIAIHRPDGLQSFYGEAIMGAGILNFWVKAVKGIGSVPVIIKGNMTNAGFVISEARSDAVIQNRQTPQKVTPPVNLHTLG
jgi:hypothetical protein